MIQKINTVSFGKASINKNDSRQASATREQLIEGSIGAGGAAAVANGNKIIKATSTITKKATNIASKVPENTKKFGNFFTGMLKSTGKIKGLKWVATTAQHKAVKGCGKFLGGFAAVSICITDFANIINVFGGQKLTK